MSMAMGFCTKCNSVMSSNFCPYCGKKTEKNEKVCMYCEQVNERRDKFCRNCGRPIQEGKGGGTEEKK